MQREHTKKERPYSEYRTIKAVYICSLFICFLSCSLSCVLFASQLVFEGMVVMFLILCSANKHIGCSVFIPIPIYSTWIQIEYMTLKYNLIFIIIILLFFLLLSVFLSVPSSSSSFFLSFSGCSSLCLSFRLNLSPHKCFIHLRCGVLASHPV